MNVLMMIKSKAFEDIMQGRKIVEVRMSAPKEDVDTVYFHVFGGSGVLGEAKVIGVFKLLGASAKFLQNACMTAEELEAYRKGRPFFGWLLDAPVRYSEAMPIEDFGFKKAPVSWGYANREKG